jgi:hypothetical protein
MLHKFFKAISLVIVFSAACCSINCKEDTMNKEFKSESEIKNVFFHFLHAIIDENTYDEIKKTDFLKSEFCNGQEKTHSTKTATGEKFSWTGFYLIGENTYIQLFNGKDKESLQKLNVGRVGIEFMVDRKEEIEKVIKKFEQKFPSHINHGIFKKDVDNTLIPWFYFIDDSSMIPELDAGIMAYHKDYLKFKNVENSDRDVITRKEYNATCNAIPFDKTKLFKDIEEMTLSLNNENEKKIIERLVLLGYTCEESEDCIICRGPGVVLKLQSSDDKTGKFLKLQMSLNRKIDKPQSYKIGNSTIELENKTAIWTFK